jgi:hypothetical protein
VILEVIVGRVETLTAKDESLTVKDSLHGKTSVWQEVIIKFVKNRTSGRTAYADCPPTVAMIVSKTCSLIVKGPGFKWTPNIVTLGTTAAQRRPMGNDKSWASMPVC